MLYSPAVAQNTKDQNAIIMKNQNGIIMKMTAQNKSMDTAFNRLRVLHLIVHRPIGIAYRAYFLPSSVIVPAPVGLSGSGGGGGLGVVRLV